MDYRIWICKETVGITGHRTFKKIKMVPRTEAVLEEIENMNVVRRFNDPFNSSIEMVIIK